MSPLAVVTGCSSGIGRAVTEHLLGRGFRVRGLSRTAPDLAGVDWVAADLADAEQVVAGVADLGSVDAVVHCAGFQRTNPLGSLRAGDLRAMFDVHVAAAALLVDALADRVADGGRVVLLGSRTMVGVAGKSQYAATKAALTGLSRSWAQELAPRRITVNVVAPGPTETAMTHDPGRASTPVRVPPLGALVDPADVAELVGFLLGPAGRSVTGQAVVVCGGASL
ncbi:SDR family NAD(P)-dependent oxidoreductase [Kineococcus sp. TBRC 1896]|uniref:SDR family NAD(P)-dependent oxidoreductase n=1 Tax=Kineococcus mangrovi TaxID=1660183 RepID=A0ABV4I8R4_9ACTN